MISICIPIYNLDVTSLVRSLYEQAEKLSRNYELVFIDDCSGAQYKEVNRPLCKRLGNYIELDQNIGRAKIRNLFLQYTQYDYLLFMDCDSVIVSDDFLYNYVDVIQINSPSIICGGRIYSEQKPEKQKLLNWKYGTQKESQPASIRKKNSNKSFMTNNFIIHRKLLEEIRFDERLTQYGHEDTLFGYQLKKRGIKIQHIDNPVLHGDLEDNSEFINKTEQGIVNLIRIVKSINYDEDFIRDVTILNYYYRLRMRKLEVLFAVLFRFTQPVLKMLLSKGFANLLLFDFYKIVFLCLKVKKDQSYQSR